MQPKESVSAPKTARCQPELMPNTTIYYSTIYANVSILIQLKNRCQRPPEVLPNALKKKASAISRPEIKRPSRWAAKVSAHTYTLLAPILFTGRAKILLAGILSKIMHTHFQGKKVLLVLSKYNTRQGKTDKTP